ncbi:MAG TPA: hypothetical protein VFQ20_14795 [Burkholderiaceae bacterium]|nr:hypothetical protein [Burkholderiaceae bacterium]
MLKLKTLTGAVLLSLASLASAQSADDDSARTAARADREMAVDGTSAVTVPRGAAGAQGRAFKEPGLTRAEVKAELMRWIKSGERERHIAEQGGH